MNLGSMIFSLKKTKYMTGRDSSSIFTDPAFNSDSDEDI